MAAQSGNSKEMASISDLVRWGVGGARSWFLPGPQAKAHLVHALISGWGEPGTSDFCPADKKCVKIVGLIWAVESVISYSRNRKLIHIPFPFEGNFGYKTVAQTLFLEDFGDRAPRGFPGGSVVEKKKKKICLPIQETWVPFLTWEDPLEKEMAAHSSILALRIPGTEEPGGLQSTGSRRVGHDWSNSACMHTQAVV